FAVADERYLLTFATLFVVGLLLSALMARVRGTEREAVEREKHTAALYSLSRALSAATGEAEVAQITARHSKEAFGGEAEVLLEAGVDGAGRDDGDQASPRLSDPPSVASTSTSTSTTPAGFRLITGTGDHGTLVLTPGVPPG